MRKLLGLSIFAVAVSCAPPAADTRDLSAASPAAIFREIVFSPYQAITLGERIPEGAPPTRMVRPGQLALARPHFGGTDSIYIGLDDDQRVAGFYFIYPDSQAFAPSVAEYVEMLGAPRRVTSDSAGGRLERVVWTDSATYFEFTEWQKPGARRRMWSFLRDRSGSD